MWTSAYINGQWVSRKEAVVPIEDRGLLFADGVYEVIQYYNGEPVAFDAHLRRMERSLGEIRVEAPPVLGSLRELSKELIERNGFRDASVYWQISRGVALRNHPFPTPAGAGTVFMMAYETPPFDASKPMPTLSTITAPDERWGRCDIKSIMLLPNVLARQAAADAGGDEAILLRDGVVMEATSKAIAIVRGGALVFPPLDSRILPSITREIAIEEARAAGIRVREEYFSAEEMVAADEVLALSTTLPIGAVTNVDGVTVGAGAPGPVGKQLFRAYGARIARECGIEVVPAR